MRKDSLSLNTNSGKTSYNAAINMVRLVLTLTGSVEAVPEEQLIEEIEVSQRTLQRYIKTINENFSSKDGGDKLRKERKNGKTSYTLADHEAVTANFFKAVSVYTGFMLLRSMEGTLLEAGIRQAYDEVKKGLESVDKKELNKFDRKISYSGFARKNYAQHKHIIRAILEALINNNKVKIDYLKVGAVSPKTHSLCPYTLCLHKDSLYLFASKGRKEKVKTYKVERMVNAEVLKDTFSYPSAGEYSPGEVTEGTFGIYEKRYQENERVEVLFDEDLHEYVTGRTWHPSQTFSQVKDGWFSMELTLNTTIELIPWILQFGSKVRVLKPVTLREKIKKELMMSLSEY